MKPLLSLKNFVFIVFSSVLFVSTSAALAVDASPLDEPIPVQISQSGGAATISAKDAAKLEKELVKEVRKEQQELAALPLAKLEKQAEEGERLAQVELGVNFAVEASQLSFAPAAANDAVSDAMQWYNAAAKRGFPGAPSLDLSGVQFYPVRAYR